MQCYRLRFHGPLHVDGRGTGFYEQSEAFIHSDTLSAAVLSAWALLDPSGAAERAAKPPFLLSSAFPYYGDAYFLPRPVASLALRLPPKRLREHKAIKKIQWLETSLWRQAAITGEGWEVPTDIVVLQDALGLPRTLAAKLRELPKRLWAEEERPRLAVDRASGSPVEQQLFHFSRIHFHPAAGLYFLARFENATSRPAFEAALSLLGDSGIGADRTGGNGLFNWKQGMTPALSVVGKGRAIALSLVNPAPTDMAAGWLDAARYNVVSRGGWIGHSGLRRKRVRMFSEGSLFAAPLTGQVIDVTPEDLPSLHPVYRDGRGFFVVVEQAV